MIEVLREVVPTASKIAVLANPGNPMHRFIMSVVRTFGADRGGDYRSVGLVRG